MTDPHVRDFVGYGPNPPDPKWPGGARLAINFVINVEEGSEPSFQDGEGTTETQHTEAFGRPALKGRDLAGEGMFEYGSRVGFWRVLGLFQERKLPVTFFACALALERNARIAKAIRDSGMDVCSHGWRWVKHFDMPEDEERRQIQRAMQSFAKTLGQQPEGWYCRYGPSLNTRRLLAEHGGFLYCQSAANFAPRLSSAGKPGSSRIRRPARTPRRNSTASSRRQRRQGSSPTRICA